MNFWFYLICIISGVILFKIYITQGVFQASTSKKWTVVYSAFSFITLIIGVYTLINSFSGGIIGLSILQNFIIALMISVIICECFVAFFFVIDDVFRITKFLSSSKNTKQNFIGKSRRRFLKTTGLILGSIPFTNFLYGITKGKYDFKVFEETLSFSDLPKSFDGFKIVQFSDLHSGGFDSYEDVKRGFEMIQAQQADLILFTGDLVNDLADEILPYKSLLKNLTAPFGKFSVLGNHDYPEDLELFPDEAAKETNFLAIKQHHADTDFVLLNNANIKIEKEKHYIRLLGVENWGNSFIKEGDLDKALEGCESNEFSILMSHDPTHWEEKVLKHSRHIHLTLAGHTHGMQMGIEALGIKWSPIQYFYKRWAGLYRELGQYLYVNRGFGFMAFAGRVGIPPEITVFTLKKSD